MPSEQEKRIRLVHWKEDVIRQVALDREMVDTKVCAIDETWSGLRLTRRRT